MTLPEQAHAIIEWSSAYFGISKEEVLRVRHSRRTCLICDVKVVSVFVMKNDLNMTWAEMKRFFTSTDHSTLHYYYKIAIDRIAQKDERIGYAIAYVRRELGKTRTPLDRWLMHNELSSR